VLSNVGNLVPSTASAPRITILVLSIFVPLTHPGYTRTASSYKPIPRGHHLSLRKRLWHLGAAPSSHEGGDNNRGGRSSDAAADVESPFYLLIGKFISMVPFR